MNIIDKKGKLFGIINIIDLFILIVLGSIIVFGVSRMRGPQVVSSGTKEGIIRYEISDVRDITVENIKVGEPIYHYDKGTYIGEIARMDVRPLKEKLDYEGEWINAVVPERYIVTIDVKADINENDQYYTAGGEQTRVGIQYRIKNKSFASFGVCIGVEITE